MQSSPVGQAFLVGLGGFVGASARHLLGRVVSQLMPAAAFPVGTLSVNLLGCLVIGVLAGRMEAGQLMEPGWRLFLIVGVLGGFTTFSTFAAETLGLFQEEQFVRAAVYAAGQLLFCLAAVWIGQGLARHN